MIKVYNDLFFFERVGVSQLQYSRNIRIYKISFTYFSIMEVFELKIIAPIIIVLNPLFESLIYLALP